MHLAHGTKFAESHGSDMRFCKWLAPGCLAMTLFAGGARAQTAPRVIHLEQAVNTGLDHQPAVISARAQSEAADGRYEQARSGYLPQVTGTAVYQRVHATTQTARVTDPTTGVSTGGGQIGQKSNYWSAGLSASQLIYDFGATPGRMRAATATHEAFESAERTARFQVALNVRQAFFQARVQRALIRVGEETVQNQERHLAQIQGFVDQGIRPEIDLAQAKTDLANSRVTLINAQNGYVTAKAQLNQAMGVPGGTDYDVAEDEIGAISGEDGNAEVLMRQALDSRPELATFARQMRAAEATVSSIEGAYGPSLRGIGGISEAGPSLDALGLNWNVGVNLTWPLFQGGLTKGQVKEARANVDVAKAQQQQAVLDVRLQVEQARLAVGAAKVVIVAAQDALANAKERLRLAEGRYEAGVGNIIELDDAELAAASAGAQLAQAEFSLASARAGLLSALGK